MLQFLHLLVYPTTYWKANYLGLPIKNYQETILPHNKPRKDIKWKADTVSNCQYYARCKHAKQSIFRRKVLFLAEGKGEIPVSLAAVFQVNLPTFLTHLSVIHAILEECSVQVHILR